MLNLMKVYITLIVTLVIVPGVIFISSIDKTADINIFLSFLIIAYSSFRLSWLTKSIKNNLVYITFWIFVYIWLGLSSFTQILSNKFPWKGYYSHSTLTLGLIIVWIGIIFYELGIYISNRQIKNVTSKKFKLVISEKKVIIFSLFSILVCTGMTFKLGGLQILFLSRTDYTSLFSDNMSQLIYSNLLRVPIFIALVGVILVLKNKNSNVKHPTLLFSLLVILSIFNLIVNNPVSNARYWFGSVALTLLLLILKWKNNSSFKWTFSFLLILIFIFPYADYFRTQQRGIELESLSIMLATNGDYDAFQMLLNTIVYVGIYGITFGKQLLGSLLFWVPRSIWETKPHGSGGTVAEALNYKFTNLSSPYWAEGYVNFGLFGVMVFLFLYGFFTGKLQKSFLEIEKYSMSSLEVFLIYYLSSFQIFLLRGDLLNATAYLSTVIFFFLLCIKLSSKPMGN